jgi:hypothetical protein
LIILILLIRILRNGLKNGRLQTIFQKWFKQKYIVEVANNIKHGTNGEVFEFKNREGVKLQILIDDEWEEKKLIISTNFADFVYVLLQELNRKRIYLNLFTDEETEFEYQYSIVFENIEKDLKLFIAIIHQKFGFVYRD